MKIYCASCQKRVSYKIQKVENKTNYTCIKCGNLLRVKEGISWKLVHSEQ